MNRAAGILALAATVPFALIFITDGFVRQLSLTTMVLCALAFICLKLGGKSGPN